MTKGPEFPHRSVRKEIISVTLRRVAEKSIAVADGTETDFTDTKTGEVTKREKWFFLPRKWVEIEGVDMSDDMALQAKVNKVVKVEAGERMLIEKGLL